MAQTHETGRAVGAARLGISSFRSGINSSENPIDSAAAQAQFAAPAVCIIRIDPGLSGAISFYFPEAPDRVIAEDMPVAAGMIDCATLAARIRQMAPSLAIVERVASMPKQGVSTTFKFGTAYGAILGGARSPHGACHAASLEKTFPARQQQGKGPRACAADVRQDPRTLCAEERPRERRGSAVGALWRDYGRRCAMTALALITGVLFRAPEQRTSKLGKPFVTATIRAKDGETTLWWKVVAFSESAQAELMRLVDGDSLAVQGSFRAELYQPEGGEPKVSPSIIADHVLSLRQPPRERKAPASGPPRDAPARGGAAAFDDSIPFGFAP
jgi:single-stranded DNA-binding protein